MGMKDIVQILAEIIAGFSYEVSGEWQDNGDGTYTLVTCNTHSLRNGKVITIDGEDYQVVDFVLNESVTVKPFGSGTLPASSIIIPPPFFFHGTPMMTNEELALITNSANKVPFIYLLETITERIYNEDSNVSNSAVVHLFFLDEADRERWLTNDHYREVIRPMRNMALNFIDYLENNRYIRELDNFDVKYHANFGVFQNMRGNISQLFDDELSGCEVIADLDFFRKKICCN